MAYRGAAAGVVIALGSVFYADSWPKKVFGLAIGLGIAAYEWRRAQELVLRRRSSRQLKLQQRKAAPDHVD